MINIRLSLVFNKTCIQENLLPAYTHTHTHIYIYIYILFYIFLIVLHLGVFISFFKLLKAAHFDHR